MTDKELSKLTNQRKMLMNTKTAIEQMDNKECKELFGIAKDKALSNTENALERVELQLFRANHPLTGVDKTILEIAMKNIIAVEERGSLETRRCDCEDFFEVGVWELEKALKEAYEAGRKSK